MAIERKHFMSLNGGKTKRKKYVLLLGCFFLGILIGIFALTSWKGEKEQYTTNTMCLTRETAGYTGAVCSSAIIRFLYFIYTSDMVYLIP